MRVIEGDCRAVLADLPADSIDAVVTDPPAGIAFMGREWDHDKGGRDHWIAWMTEIAAECLRVAKPGAHALVWALPRTSHWTATAWENAGWTVRDRVSHLFGTGFPKSLNVSVAIDRAAGMEREVVGRKTGRAATPVQDIRGGSYAGGNGRNSAADCSAITAPATPEAAQWSGWGTALKPACEDWWLLRKPLGERTVAANVLRHGTGAINIDACRVAGAFKSGWSDSGSKASENVAMSGANYARDPVPDSAAGRWPANVLHDGSDEVEAAFAAFGDAGGGYGRAGGNQQHAAFGGGMQNRGNTFGFGDTGSASRFFFQAKPDYRCDLCGLLCDGERANIATCNASNAASLFPASESADSAPIVALEPLPHASEDSSRPQTLPVVNAGESSTPCHQPTRCSAPSNAETWPLPKIVRNVKSAASLCDSCATAIAQNLARVRCSLDSRSLPLVGCMPASRARILNQCLALYVERRESTDTILTTESLSTLFGSVLHAIAESTRSESVASSANTECVPTRFHYSSKADKDDRAGSSHPTVKPISLLQWLVRLITPPGGTCLDPFAGSGTTAEAAMLEGFDAILIEKDPASVKDIRHRLSRWSGGDMPLFAPVPAPPEDARLADLFREPEATTLGG